MVRLRHGGFTPRIGGRPTRDVVEVAFPNRVIVSLRRGDLEYSPLVASGDPVRFGEPLAKASAAGGMLMLPSPASGRVVLEESSRRIVLEGVVEEASAAGFEPLEPQRATPGAIREALCRGGVWPLLWSSRTGGMPRLDDGERPRYVAVNFILTEPFRARGRVIITRSWDRIVQGLRFLQRLIDDYGRIEIILTEPNDPVARMMASDLRGYAWVRFHSVPLTYPIENPRALADSLRRAVRIDRGADIWVIDAQGAEAAGGCLGEGLPLHERVVATGGPGQSDPKHLAVRIGTPLASFLQVDPARTRLLRGGLLTGSPADPEQDAVGYDDDAFFFLPEPSRREPVSFLRPGFDRASYSRAFASGLWGGRDRHITTSLRGERRPCISCGLCETVCPAGIMPQVIHRYLHRGLLDEAEKAGVERCIDCNLCTYVCPSKIELQRQFAGAKLEIAREREELRTAELASRGANTDEAKP